MKTVKKLFTVYGKHSNIVTYEYKGKQYDVEYANNYTYCVTPAHIQHKDAQAKIDKIIEQESKESKSEQPIEEFDINAVFTLLGWD